MEENNNKNTENHENRNEITDVSLKSVSELFSRHANSSNVTPREGFKQALKSRIRETRDKPMTKQSFSWMRGLPMKLAAGGATGLVVLIISMLIFEPAIGPILNTVPEAYAQDNFTLLAQDSDSLGVSTDTNFVIESKEEIDIDYIREHLSTNVEIPFKVKKLSKHQAEIILEEDLNEDEVVQFVLDSSLDLPGGEVRARPYGWAFQVASSFKISGTIPGDKTQSVALDTGIEIVFSNDGVDPDDFQDAFSVVPAVPGHVEKFRKSLVWVPDSKALTPETAYTVTVSGDLPVGESGTTLGEDYVFEFETSGQGRRGSRIYLNRPFITESPDDQPEMQLYFYGKSEMIPNAYYGTELGEALNVTLYEFDSTEKYLSSIQNSTHGLWRQYQKPSEFVDVSSLEESMTFSIDIGTNDRSPEIIFPTSVPEGQYFGTIEANGLTTWFFLQSTWLSAYATTADGKAIAWVNDVQSGQPVSNAELLDMDNQVVARTDSQGVMKFDSNRSMHQLLFKSGDQVLFMDLSSSYVSGGMGWYGGYGGASNDNKYWGYLDMDRNKFLPGDKVNLFGFLKERSTNRHPKDVSIWIGSSSWQDSKIVYDRVSVDLSDEGTYTAELQLPDSVSWRWLYANVEIDGEIVQSKSFTVSEYRKPVMQLDVEFEKDAAFSGERAGYTIRGEYFDGTPAANQEVLIDYSKKEIVLDENGEYHGDLFLSSSKRNKTLSAAINLPGSGEIFGSDNIVIFPANLIIDSESDVEDGVATVNIDTFNVDLENSLSKDRNIYSAIPFKGARKGNVSLDVSVTKTTWERVVDGTYYDVVRKVTREKSRYVKHTEEIFDGDYITNDQGEIEFTFDMKGDSYHKVTINGIDEKGRSVTAYEYVYNRSSWIPRDFDSTEFPVFVNADDPESERYGAVRDEGESLHLEVHMAGELLELPADSSILYYEAQQGVKNHSIESTPKYEKVMRFSDAPNVNIYGVIFTGDGYAEVRSGYWSEGYPVTFEKESKRLDIEVIPEKDVFKPGEEAVFDVLVKDQDGNGVEADVNMKIVDEAFYAITYENQTDPLVQIYRNVGSGILRADSSHLGLAEMSGGAEGGGGGGDARESFQDTSVFKTIRTNSDGIAEMNIQLADNLTNWRVTTQAIDSDDLQAGLDVINVKTQIPFFVRSAVQESYLENDVPLIPVYSAGIDVNLNDRVDYTMSIEDLGIEQSQSATVREQVVFPLRDLPVGDHRIVIHGSSGDYEDAVAHKIRVVESRVTRPQVSTFDLNEGETVGLSGSGEALVSFMNSGQGKFYNRLRRYAHWYGDRADEASVRFTAREILNDYFGENVAQEQLITSKYQTSEGAIRLLPHADPDLILSAKLALLESTPFDEDVLEHALREALSYDPSEEDSLTKEEYVWVLSGLAALDAPVLLELQRLAETELSQNEGLITAIGLAFAGDLELSREIYRDLLALSTEEMGYIYLDGDDGADVYEQTALFAVLAGVLYEDHHEQIYKYITSQWRSDALVVLEEILYVKHVLPNLNEEQAKIRVTFDGETESIDLKNRTTFGIYVDEEDLDSLEYVVEKGDVVAVVTESVPVMNFGDVNEKISVVKEYSSLSGEKKAEFDQDEIVRVTIRYKLDDALPKTSYQVTDAIPSGLTPLTRRASSYDNGSSSWCSWFSLSDTDQTISFNVYPGAKAYKSCKANEIVYYARVMNPGTFEVEPTTIRSNNDISQANFSAQSSVLILNEK